MLLYILFLRNPTSLFYSISDMNTLHVSSVKSTFLYCLCSDTDQTWLAHPCPAESLMLNFFSHVAVMITYFILLSEHH